MLFGSSGRLEYWPRVPELVVLASVMDAVVGDQASATATAESLPSEELDALIADLTTALGILTNRSFEQFAAIRREFPVAGALVGVLRPGQIVAARYRDVRARLRTIGYGGRRTRGDGTITAGAVVLDDEFDRSSASRHLLRTHELGHALGYNHVSAPASIMNPQIGAGISDLDRQAVRIAFPPCRSTLE
jgi:hypothetical protein